MFSSSSLFLMMIDKYIIEVIYQFEIRPVHLSLGHCCFSSLKQFEIKGRFLVVVVVDVVVVYLSRSSNMNETRVKREQCASERERERDQNGIRFQQRWCRYLISSSRSPCRPIELLFIFIYSLKSTSNGYWSSYSFLIRLLI